MKEKISKKKTLGEKRPRKHSVTSKHKSIKHVRSIDDDDDEIETAKRSYIKLKQPNNVGKDDRVVDKKKGVGKIKQHRDELEGLEETDPEFFNFLKENDKSLLDFRNDDDEDDEEEDDDDIDNLSDGSDDDDETNKSSKSKKGQKKKKGKIEVTNELLNNIIDKVINHNSFTELKKLLSIFRAACIPSGEEAMNNDSDSDREEKSVSRYLIPNPEIYEKVMVGVIDNAQIAFRNHFDIDNKNISSLKVGDHPKWKKFQLLVLSFFKSLLHTISGMESQVKPNSDAESVMVYLIDSLAPYTFLLSPLPRLSKGLIKVLLNIWGQVVINPSEKEDSIEIITDTKKKNNKKQSSKSLQLKRDPRTSAFLRLLSICKTVPGAIGEECFRSIYLKFARTAKSFSETNASTIYFMTQCVAELYATDPSLAYQQSFLYIRQLALHLRAAIMKKSSETTREVCSWQFLNCIRVWTRVICLQPSSEEGLGKLAFPLSQVIFGVMSLIPSVYYLPLKFHLIRCLHLIAAACKSFIPTSTKIFEILEHPDLISKTTPSTALAPNLTYLVQLPVDSITTVTTRDVVIQEAINLLRQDAEVYKYHVGYPEYTFLSIRKLKSFAKKCKISKWRDLIRTLSSQLEQFSANVKTMRCKLAQPPMSIIDFEPLLPSHESISFIRLSKLLATGNSNSVSYNENSVVITSVSNDNNNDSSNNDSKPIRKSLMNKFEDRNKVIEEEDDEDDEEEDNEDDKYEEINNMDINDVEDSLKEFDEWDD